jgi:hypothetical protein
LPTSNTRSAVAVRSAHQARIVSAAAIWQRLEKHSESDGQLTHLKRLLSRYLDVALVEAITAGNA